VGVLGALTTFSTFGVETLVLARASGMGAALGNVALHLALGLGGVAAGYALAGALAD
jgi:CrcB protein